MRHELLEQPVVMRGVVPRIHLPRKKSFSERWIAGASPAMVVSTMGYPR